MQVHSCPMVEEYVQSDMPRIRLLQDTSLELDCDDCDQLKDVLRQYLSLERLPPPDHCDDEKCKHVGCKMKITATDEWPEVLCIGLRTNMVANIRLRHRTVYHLTYVSRVRAVTESISRSQE